jgi:hypothetical protein
VRPSWREAHGIEPLRQEAAAADLALEAGGLSELFVLGDWAAASGPQDKRRSAASRIAFAAITGRMPLLDARFAPADTEIAAIARALPALPVRALAPHTADAWPELAQVEPRRVWVLAVDDGSASARDLGRVHAPGASFVVVDVRERAVVHRGELPFDAVLEAHDSRVLSIHQDSGHPDVVGASGGYLARSARVRDVVWDAAALRLSGAAALGGRDGDELTLDVYCPEGLRPGGVDPADATLAVEGGLVRIGAWPSRA